jgi:hypothetical protein
VLSFLPLGTENLMFRMNEKRWGNIKGGGHILPM